MVLIGLSHKKLFSRLRQFSAGWNDKKITINFAKKIKVALSESHVKSITKKKISPVLLLIKIMEWSANNCI